MSMRRGYTRAALKAAERVGQCRIGMPDLEDAAIIDAAFRPAIDALLAIRRAEGAFSRDLLTHASNTIAESKRLADHALACIGIPEGWK